MQKISIVILVSICSVGWLYSQDQAKYLAGGNFSFSSSKGTTSGNEMSLLDLNISPSVGIMVNSNSAIGLSFTVNYFRRKDNSSVTNTDTNLGIFPFLRIHKTITENFKYYIEPKIGLYFLSLNQSSNGNLFSVSTEVGLLYFVSQKLSMELSVAGISFDRHSDKDTGFKYNAVNMGYNLVNPNLGLRYYF